MFKAICISEAILSIPEDMVEVEIDSIRVSLMSQQRIVILREKNAERYLPIWIGPYEAEAITMALQDVEVARPLTHDLLNSVFRTLDARILRVEVTTLRNDVFYGNIVAEINGLPFELDSRPSDALALSVRAHVPILISAQVMDAAGITPEVDLGEDAEDSLDDDAHGEEVDEERLSVFEDFFDNLDFGGSDDDDDDDDSDVPED